MYIFTIILLFVREDFCTSIITLNLHFYVHVINTGIGIMPFVVHNASYVYGSINKLSVP